MTPSDVLKVLADEAIRDLAVLQRQPVYNSGGNHDATHRPEDLKSDRALVAIHKATTVLRLVSMLIDNPAPGTDLVPHRDSSGRFTRG
jgi:hypothetical protein